MTTAAKLKTYLDDHSIDYELVPHPHTEYSMATAAAAHVPGDRLAKAVIVSRAGEYLMVVVPSDYHVHLGLLRRHLGQEVGLVTEEEVVRLFSDCEAGAIPPIGAPYGLPTMLDTALLDEPEIFFESGDHSALVRVSGDQFREILRDAERVEVGQHI
ncbi:MAG: YbaK/EbsC family protein [Chromatiaceae bacterium]